MDKEQKPNLLLSDEEISQRIQQDTSKWAICNKEFLMEVAHIVAKAELDHLKKLGIVYVKNSCKYLDGINKVCNNPTKGICPDEFTDIVLCYQYIPLSDYRKGEGK